MLVVGDSRVKELEKAAAEMTCEGWRIEFLYTAGANLDQAVELIKGWRHRRFPDRPKMIIMISLFHDLVVKFNLPDGKTFLRLAEEVMGKGRYPALTGLENKIREVERSLRKWWGEIELLWINPYPIDVRRWTEGRLKEKRSLSGEEIHKCHNLTLELANWLDRANCIGTRINGMGDRFIPWYVFWNDAKRSDVNFSAFQKEYKKGTDFGWINRNRTVDGFLPAGPLARQTIKMFFRKAQQAVPSPESLITPAARVTELAESPSPTLAPSPRDSIPLVAKVTDPVEAPSPTFVEVGTDPIPALEDQCAVSPEFCSATDDTADGLMKRFAEIDLLRMTSKHPSKYVVEFGVPVESVKEYIKTIYPCGHSLPYEIVGVRKYSSVCPVCGKGWGEKKALKQSFHVYDFSG